MSLNNVPSKKEMMRWNSQSLADYMRRLNLSGCEKAVVKGGISGAQFMNMTELDLQVFPSLHIPIMSKIQSQINKGEQKKSAGQKSKAQKFPQQAFVQEEEEEVVWDSDEFENESDFEEEAQRQEREEAGYICPLTEPEEEASSDEYEIPEVSIKRPMSLTAAKRQDSKDRDPVPLPAQRTGRPPLSCPPKVKEDPPRPPKASGQPVQPVDRSKKPGKCGPSKIDPKISKGGTVEASSSSTSRVPKPRPPKLSDLSNRTTTPIPSPPAPPQPTKASMSTPDSEQNWCSGHDLDPSWYGGQVTRHQAEVALREVNKDGTFIVRDSSTCSEDHPYTLMLLKQEKVFNIKIRNQGNSYTLGTRLNNKSFPGVKEMITHHTHTPLLLIDAADQSSEAQSQCCLLHPAGL